MNHENWAFKYAPKTLKDCILPESMCRYFDGIITDKEIDHLILYGSPGTGKTTMARVFAKELNRELFEKNAPYQGTFEDIKDIEIFASHVSFFHQGKMCLIDEADGLPPKSMDAFKALLEKFAGLCPFILTTNKIKKIPEPIRSRCLVLEMGGIGNDESDQSLKEAISKRIHAISRNEGIDNLDEILVRQIVDLGFPDIRTTIKIAYQVIKRGLPFEMAAGSLNLPR